MFDIITYTFLFVALFFEVFLLVTFVERKMARRLAPSAESSTQELPSVCIVVPCFNEEKTLVNSLGSLLSLDYPKEKIAIIVVNDGSTDQTQGIAEAFVPQNNITILRKENGGKHSALNLALANTNAELIGCLDADSTVAPNALRAVVRAFQNPDVAAVTPGILVRKPETLLQHIQNVEYRISIFNRYILSALGSAFITPGPFSIFRARVVRELGGWRHGHSTEDMELALRMQAFGHLIANAPGATVHTTTPRTLRALFRQRVRWTYGFMRNALDYRRLFFTRSYGNPGILVLPTAIISIIAALYFFARILWHGAVSALETYTRVQLTGFLPFPSFEMYYVNTSAVLFLVYISILLIVALIGAGSLIGEGRVRLPRSTILFLLCYGFLAPMWLGTAVVRALLGAGVRWR